VREDLRRVLDFLFFETDFHVYELYSEFGQQLREFGSFDELDAVFGLGHDRYGSGCAALLALWSPSVTPSPNITRVRLDPKRCKGFTFRYTIGGFGAVQLYLGGVHQNVVTKSHFGHGSHRWAQGAGCRGGVNWKALSHLSNRV